MPKFVGAFLGKFLIRTFRLNPQKSGKKCPKVSKLERGGGSPKIWTMSKHKQFFFIWSFPKPINKDTLTHYAPLEVLLSKDRLSEIST